MNRPISLFLQIVLFTSFLFPIVFSCQLRADGCFFSEEDMDLFEPSQKAIIIWRPYTEVLIVSSMVKAERLQDLENLAWIIPIFSGRKPTVEPCSIEIFKAFEDYFPKVLKQSLEDSLDAEPASAGGGSFQVLEQKKIDVYDISIIKATDVSVMMSWLNKNGYHTPKVARETLEVYVNEGAHYFIANKINWVRLFCNDNFSTMQLAIGPFHHRHI